MNAFKVFIIEGRLTSNEENADRRLEIIACRSFDEIRYELNGTEIDHNRNVGMNYEGLL